MLKRKWLTALVLVAVVLSSSSCDKTEETSDNKLEEVLNEQYGDIFSDYINSGADISASLNETQSAEYANAMNYDPDNVVDIFSELEPYIVYSGHDEDGKVDLQFPEGFKWQVGDYYFKDNGSSFGNRVNVIYDNEVVNTISYLIRIPETKLKAGEEFTVYTVCESSLNQMFRDRGSEYVVLGESDYDNSSVYVTTTVEKNYVFPSIGTPLKEYSDFKDEYMDAIQQYVADYWHNSSTSRVNDDVKVCEAVLGCVKEEKMALYGGEKVIIYVRMKNHSLSGIWASTDDVYALTGLAISNDGKFLINGIEKAGNIYNDSGELLADKLAASGVNTAYDLFVLKSSVEESTEEENYVKNADIADIKDESVMTYAEYAVAALDTEVVIEAYVQAKQSWWDNKATFYLQDKDGAYFVYEMGCTEKEYEKLTPGTKIKVTGYKVGWAGQVEIIDAKFEILEGNYVAAALDVTDKLGTNELINYQNQFVTFKDMTVDSIAYKNGKLGDDIDLTLSYNGARYSFCVESYLTGPETAVYTAVGALTAGQTVDVEGYLYWYEGPYAHITAVAVNEALDIDGSDSIEKNYGLFDEQSDFNIWIEDIESKLKLEHANRHPDRTSEENEDVFLEEIAVCTLKKGEVADTGDVILYALMLDWNDDKYIMYELTELAISNNGELVFGGLEYWELNLFTDFMEGVFDKRMKSYDISFHSCD